MANGYTRVRLIKDLELGLDEWNPVLVPRHSTPLSYHLESELLPLSVLWAPFAWISDSCLPSFYIESDCPAALWVVGIVLCVYVCVMEEHQAWNQDSRTSPGQLYHIEMFRYFESKVVVRFKRANAYESIAYKDIELVRY